MSFSSEPRGAPGHGLRDFSRPGSTFAGGPGGIKQTDRQADGGQGVHSQAVSAGAAGGYPHGADRLVGRALPSPFMACLLYTSDAADDLLCVDLGGRRIIKKKKQKTVKLI